MKVEFLARADEAAWDAFVRATPDATFFHRLAWRDVVRDRMGHEPLYLVAKDGEAIVGVLPMFLVGSLPRKKKTIEILNRDRPNLSTQSIDRESVNSSQ